MKKIMLILCAYTGIMTVGCSDEDSSGDLVGVWVAEQIVVTGCRDEARNGTEELECNISCYRLNLQSNGDYTFQQGFTTELGFWRSGDRLELCMDEEGEVLCESFNIDFAQNTFIMSTDSSSSGCVTSYVFAPEVVVVDTTQTQ